MRASRIRSDGPLDHLTQESRWGNFWLRSPNPTSDDKLTLGRGTWGGIWQSFCSFFFDGGTFVLRVGTGTGNTDKTDITDDGIKCAGDITSYGAADNVGVMDGAELTIGDIIPQSSSLGGPSPETGVMLHGGCINLRDAYSQMFPDDCFGACIYVDKNTGDVYIGSNFYHDGYSMRSIKAGWCNAILYKNGWIRPMSIEATTAGEVISLIKGGMYCQDLKAYGNIYSDGVIAGQLQAYLVTASASDTELNADTPAAAITGTTYAKVYTLTVPEEIVSTSTLRVKWTIANVTGDSCKSKVYINGVAESSEKVGAGSYESDRTVEAGDTIEVWGYVTDGDESTLSDVSICGTLSAVIEAVNPTW